MLQSASHSVTNIKNAEASLLIVEDDEEFRGYLKMNIDSTFNIFEAANGKEGWKRALAISPDCIISDVKMPLMNGLELSAKIQSDGRTAHIPVILLTGNSGEDGQLAGLKTGAVDFITKPVNFSILNTKLKNLLKLKASLATTHSRTIEINTTSFEFQSKEVKFMRHVRDYTDSHLNQAHLTVESLAKHLGVSRGTLVTRLVQFTGLKPVEYIRTVRLLKAAELLSNSDVTIGKIAQLTGLGTPSYFSRRFKEHFNELPSGFAGKKRRAK